MIRRSLFAFVGGVLMASPLMAQQYPFETRPGRPIYLNEANEYFENASQLDDDTQKAIESEVASATSQQPMTEEQVRALVTKMLADNKAKSTGEKDAKKEEKKEDPKAMSAKWNNGMELQTKDKAFRVHVGGRVQMDDAWFSTPQSIQNNINIPYADGADFRRARLRVDGTMYENYDWAAEFDFVNSSRVRNQPGNPGFFDEALTAPTDLWVQIREVPVLSTIKIGNQKEPIGFEHLVSSRFLPFMERSYAQDAFYGGAFNGFTPGVTAFNNYGHDDLGLWHVGIFKPSNNVFAFNNGDGDFSVVGRLTRALVYANDGEYLLHVGVSGREATGVSQAGVPGRPFTYRTRDAIRSGLSADWPVPASISLFGDETQSLNTELVAVAGPWTVQSEYIIVGTQNAQRTLADPSVGNVAYQNMYVQVLYYLTGEHDEYNKKTAVFERVKPHSNFSLNRCKGATGIGAWQIGARYNYLDLNDKGLNGGILNNLTVGLNWFWNPNMKWQFNYIATNRNVTDTANFPLGSGTVSGFGTRLAFDF